MRALDPSIPGKKDWSCMVTWTATELARMGLETVTSTCDSARGPSIVGEL